MPIGGAIQPTVVTCWRYCDADEPAEAAINLLFNSTRVLDERLVKNEIAKMRVLNRHKIDVIALIKLLR